MRDCLVANNWRKSYCYAEVINMAKDKDVGGTKIESVTKISLPEIYTKVVGLEKMVQQTNQTAQFFFHLFFEMSGAAQQIDSLRETIVQLTQKNKELEVALAAVKNDGEEVKSDV